jgi:hypothetical protein
MILNVRGAKVRVNFYKINEVQCLLIFILLSIKKSTMHYVFIDAIPTTLQSE